jgi:hypothetical protein
MVPGKPPEKGYSIFRIPLLKPYFEGFSKDLRKIDNFSEASQEPVTIMSYL